MSERKTHLVTDHSSDVCLVYPPASTIKSAEETAPTNTFIKKTSCTDETLTQQVEAGLTWCLAPSSTGSILHCIWTTWNTNTWSLDIKVKKHYLRNMKRLKQSTLTLPSWSPALRVQVSGFWLRGGWWATSPPPAGVVVDMVLQRQSEGRSRSWCTRKMETVKFFLRWFHIYKWQHFTNNVYIK